MENLRGLREQKAQELRDLLDSEQRRYPQNWFGVDEVCPEDSAAFRQMLESSLEANRNRLDLILRTQESFRNFFRFLVFRVTTSNIKAVLKTSGLPPKED